MDPAGHAEHQGTEPVNAQKAKEKAGEERDLVAVDSAATSVEGDLTLLTTVRTL